MSNQIIKYPIPSQLLFDLLDKICLKKENYYLVDMNAYRKMMFHNYHEDFCNDLKEYYLLVNGFI